MIRRLAAVALLIIGVAGATAWARSYTGEPPPPAPAEMTTTSTTAPSTSAGPVAEPPPDTTPAAALAPRDTTPDRMPDTGGGPDTGWPGPIPAGWGDRLSLVLPATPTRPGRSVPVIPVGPLHAPDTEWYPAFGTVEVYQDQRLALPCEGGAVFALGHANYSTVDQGWDVFYDVVDSERYEGDSGLEVGQEIVIALDDGTEVCRYEVFDLVDGPGEHLAASPGRYFLKTALSGEPDDPTGGPDDQLIRRAWDTATPTLYLLGSYAGPSGDEMDATGRHQAYNFVVAAALVPTG